MVEPSASPYGCGEDAYVCMWGLQAAGSSDGCGSSELGSLTPLMSSCMTWLPGPEMPWTPGEQQDV